MPIRIQVETVTAGAAADLVKLSTTAKASGDSLTGTATAAAKLKAQAESMTASVKSASAGLDGARSSAEAAGSRLESTAGHADAVASKGAQAAGALSGLGDLVGGKFGSAMMVGGTAMQAFADAGDLVNVVTESAIVKKLKDIATTTAHRVATMASTVATYAQAAAQRVLNAAMKANPIGLVVVALSVLAAGLVLAYKKSETFRNIVNGAWGAVRAATGAVFGWVQDKVSSVMTFIGTTLPSKARSAVEGAVNAWTSLRERTTAMFEAVVTAVRQKIGNVVETVTGLKDKVTGALSGAGTWLTEIGKNIIQGLVNGLDAAKQWVIDKIQEITDSIPGWVKKRLGIASPSKVMAELGREAGRGLVVGLDGERSQVERSADLLARTLVKGFGTPQLTARAVVAGQGSRLTPQVTARGLLAAAGATPGAGSGAASPTTIRLHLTGDAVHEIERGRTIVRDVDAYLAAGGRSAHLSPR